MALTFVSQPAANSYHFAGDPLLIKVHSDLVDPTLRCTAIAIVYIDGIGYITPTIYALPDANNDFEFNFRKYFMDLFRTVLPAVPAPDLNTLLLLSKHLGSAQVIIDEVSGDPLSVTDSVNSNLFNIIRGGTSWEQFYTLEFLSTYQPWNKQFLTWQSSPVKIHITQPHYCTFLQPHGTTDWTVEVNCIDKDGTVLGTLTVFTQTGGPNVGLYCIPVGFYALGLDAEAYADQIDRYTVHVRDGATLLSELRLYMIDRNFRRYQRHFVYINSLGGLSELTATGEGELSLPIKEQTVPRFLPGPYDVSHGQFSSLEISAQNAIKVNSGFTSRQQALQYSDILYSPWVWELLTFPVISGTTRVWVPIRKTGTNNRLIKDNDFLHTLQLEYVHNIKNNYFTPHL